MVCCIAAEEGRVSENDKAPVRKGPSRSSREKHDAAVEANEQVSMVEEHPASPPASASRRVTLAVNPQEADLEWVENIKAIPEVGEKASVNGVTQAEDKVPNKAGFEQLFSIFYLASDQAGKNLSALAEAVAAGLSGAEALNAHIVASGTESIEVGIAAAVAATQVKTAQDAVKAQQQFARRALEGYMANASAIGGLFNSGAKASMRPLLDRYNDVSKLAAR
jgi:hypothetical protein